MLMLLCLSLHTHPSFDALYLINTSVYDRPSCSDLRVLASPHVVHRSVIDAMLCASLQKE
jgi:hypothetical protein